MNKNAESGFAASLAKGHFLNGGASIAPPPVPVRDCAGQFADIETRDGAGRTNRRVAFVVKQTEHAYHLVAVARGEYAATSLSAVPIPSTLVHRSWRDDIELAALIKRQVEWAIDGMNTVKRPYDPGTYERAIRLCFEMKAAADKRRTDALDKTIKGLSADVSAKQKRINAVEAELAVSYSANQRQVGTISTLQNELAGFRERAALVRPIGIYGVPPSGIYGAIPQPDRRREFPSKGINGRSSELANLWERARVGDSFVSRSAQRFAEKAEVDAGDRVRDFWWVNEFAKPAVVPAGPVWGGDTYATAAAPPTTPYPGPSAPTTTPPVFEFVAVDAYKDDVTEERGAVVSFKIDGRSVDLDIAISDHK